MKSNTSKRAMSVLKSNTSVCATSFVLSTYGQRATLHMLSQLRVANRIEDEFRSSCVNHSNIDTHVNLVNRCKSEIHTKIVRRELPEFQHPLANHIKGDNKPS